MCEHGFALVERECLLGEGAELVCIEMPRT
jgi:hypothetical protein